MNGRLILTEARPLLMKTQSEVGDKRFSFLLVLYIIFGVYKLPFMPALSIGDLILLYSMIDITIRRKRIRVYNNIFLHVFIVYALVVSFLAVLIEHGNVNETVKRIVRDAFFYVYIYIFAYSYIDYKSFVRSLKYISILLSSYIIIQQLIYIVSGYLLPGFFLNATVSQSVSASQIYQHTLLFARRNGYLKANGFLTEGAHCAQALSIALVATFDFNKIDKASVRVAVFFTFGSVLTFSASSLVFFGILWIFIIIKMIRNKQFSLRIGLPILALLVGVSIFAFIGLESNLTAVLSRLVNASTTETADGSSYFRLYKGLVFWNGLPLVNKFFGIGFGNYESLYTLYEGSYTQILVNEYMNSLSYILVSSGLVGMVLFLVYFVGLFKTSNYKGKVTIILLLFMSISSSPYISYSWAMMMVIIMCNSSKNRTMI